MTNYDACPILYCTSIPKSGSPDVPRFFVIFPFVCFIFSSPVDLDGGTSAEAMLLRSVAQKLDVEKAMTYGNVKCQWILWVFEVSKQVLLLSINSLTFAVSMHTTCRQRNYGLDGKELTAEEHPLETMVDGIYTCLGP